MKNIGYEAPINDTRGSRVDALMGRSIFEYKPRISDIRVLHSAFMMLAEIMADLSDHTGILIVDNPKISRSRIESEWNSLNKLFQRNIISRFRLVITSSDSIIVTFGKPSNSECEALPHVLERMRKQSPQDRGRRPDAFYEILRILLIHWFRNAGPLQLNRLGQLSGFSYPRVSASLDKLELSLIRHSDRSVELRFFPKGDWLKLIASSDDIRKPRGYRATRPRPIEVLIERLEEWPDRDIAHGGIIGAKYYLSGIDMVGVPRLDLCVHNWSTGKINKFIRKLDPGLKEVTPGELPQVVVHNLYRMESLFIENAPVSIADEVECLLDLYEARLESQAKELLEYLNEKAGK